MCVCNQGASRDNSADAVDPRFNSENRSESDKCVNSDDEAWNHGTKGCIIWNVFYE